MKVTDFGIARAAGSSAVTTAGTLLGTPHYISPEQVNGDTVTAASDFYALGAVAYECLTGSRLYDGDAMAVMLAHRNEAPPALPDGIPAGLRDLVMALLDKDPSNRPTDGRAIAAQADRFNSPTVAVPVSPTPIPSAPGATGRSLVHVGRAGHRCAGRAAGRRAPFTHSDGVARRFRGVGGGCSHRRTRDRDHPQWGRRQGADVDAAEVDPAGARCGHLGRALRRQRRLVRPSRRGVARRRRQHLHGLVHAALRVRRLRSAAIWCRTALRPRPPGCGQVAQAAPGRDRRGAAGPRRRRRRLAAVLTAVGSSTSAPQTLALRPTKPARYWLVWFTKLAPDDGAYRAGVAEASFAR